jgi:hypothetical protein
MKNNVMSNLNYHMRSHGFDRNNVPGSRKIVEEVKQPSQEIKENIALSKKTYRNGIRGKLNSLRSSARKSVRDEVLRKTNMVKFNTGLLNLPPLVVIRRNHRVENLCLCSVFTLLKLWQMGDETMQVRDFESAEHFLSIVNELDFMFGPGGNFQKYDINDTWETFWTDHKTTFELNNGWNQITLTDEERIAAVQVT